MTPIRAKICRVARQVPVISFALWRAHDRPSDVSMAPSLLVDFGFEALRGRGSSSFALHRGHGSPAPPLVQARSPWNGLSEWFSQTQPQSSQTKHFMVSRRSLSFHSTSRIKRRAASDSIELWCSERFLDQVRAQAGIRSFNYPKTGLQPSANANSRTMQKICRRIQSQSTRS
jgi:hypothetical protein